MDNEFLYMKSMLEIELNNLIKNTTWEIHDIVKSNNMYNSFDILTIIQNEISIIKPFLFMELNSLKSINEYYINIIKNLWIERLSIFKQNFVSSVEILKKIEDLSLKNKNFDKFFKQFPFNI